MLLLKKKVGLDIRSGPFLESCFDWAESSADGLSLQTGGLSQSEMELQRTVRRYLKKSDIYAAKMLYGEVITLTRR
jgi:hypothetical protein